jgi:hypothetical protein
MNIDINEDGYGLIASFVKFLDARFLYVLISDFGRGQL